VTGWAIDQGAWANTGVDQVHVYVCPTDAGGNVTGPQVFFTRASYGGKRPDIAGAWSPSIRICVILVKAPQVRTKPGCWEVAGVAS
jgi:hypothetical protein